jgi:glycosyltransferase involved in cell wall biosynthesis
VLIVSLGSTGGLRAADAALAASLERAGASVAVARATAPSPRRTLAATTRALRREPFASVIYSTTTAALFAPVAGAIRFDALAAANRPGRHGVWQRPLERRRITGAQLLIPWSAASLTGAASHESPTVVVPVAVAPSGPSLAPAERDIAAITYAANPHKKGLDRVLDAWSVARREGEELVVAGIAEVAPTTGVRCVGVLAAPDYRALLRRSRVYVTAPRREDYGIAQLEALADGCALVSTTAPGPYVALEIARRLDARLVGEDLAGAIRSALDEPREGYAAAAALEIEPFLEASVDRVVAEALLPALTGSA